MKKLKKLTNLRTSLLYLLPVVIYFLYYPVIPLGRSDTTNFELSLPLIWLALFALFSLPALPKAKLLKGRKKWLILAFPLYLSLTFFWTPNPLRAFLTAGIFWCLTISALTIPPLLTKLVKKRLVKIFLISSALAALWCWVQSILDLIGLSRDLSLACPGCTSITFGFPHPSGLAIEPQFMGGLLLAPSFLTLYLARTNKKLYPLAFFFMATLVLTFSRGAIYAFALGFALTIILGLIKKDKTPLKQLPLALTAFVFTVCIQGLMAQVSPTIDTFHSGVAKSLHHLSLGIVDFRPNNTPTINLEQPVTEVETPVIEATFDGYVAVSTDIRLNLTGLALDVWSKSPKTVLFGTGLGSAGTVIYDAHSEIGSPKEVVQNQYVSLLLETGLLGIAFAAIAVITYLRTLQNNLYLKGTLVAYTATLLFFSGLPNALYVYTLPPLTSKH